MAFTYDITTNLGKLRLAIGDTTSDAGPRPNAGNYSDDELGVYLTPVIAAGNTYASAVPHVLRLLSTEWAKEANISIGEYRADYAAVAANYRASAIAWENMTSTAGAMVSGGITTGAITLTNQVWEVQTDGSVI